MREIPLTQGKVTVVDDEDYEYLNQWKWQAWKPPNSPRNYYAIRKHQRNGEQKIIRMHHVLLPLLKGMQTDHIDGDSLNNRRSNLRRCTYAENQYNRHPDINTSSEYKGVSWNKNARKWQVYCGGSYCGLYANEEEAARKYDYMARLRYGKFARLNNIKVEL